MTPYELLERVTIDPPGTPRDPGFSEYLARRFDTMARRKRSAKTGRFVKTKKSRKSRRR